MKSASWVIVRKATGETIAETYLKHVAEAINKEKYTAVPIIDYLNSLNKEIKAGAARACMTHIN